MPNYCSIWIEMKAPSREAFDAYVKAFWGDQTTDSKGFLARPALARYFLPLADYPSDEQREAWGSVRDI